MSKRIARDVTLERDVAGNTLVYLLSLRFAIESSHSALFHKWIKHISYG